MWVRRLLIERILQWCAENEKFCRHALLFLVTYAFLLRLPSEALPISVGKGSGPAALYREGDTLVLALKRR